MITAGVVTIIGLAILAWQWFSNDMGGEHERQSFTRHPWIRR